MMQALSKDEALVINYSGPEELRSAWEMLVHQSISARPPASHLLLEDWNHLNTLVFNNIENSPLVDDETKQHRWNGVTQAVRYVAESQMGSYRRGLDSHASLSQLEDAIASNLHVRFHDCRTDALNPDDAEATVIKHLSESLDWIEDDKQRETLAQSEWKSIHPKTRIKLMHEQKVSAAYYKGDANLYGHLLWEIMTPRKITDVRRAMEKYRLPNLYEEDLLNSIDSALYFVIDKPPTQNFVRFANGAINSSVRQSVRYIMESYVGQRPYDTMSLDAQTESGDYYYAGRSLYEPSNAPKEGLSQIGELLLKAREAEVEALVKKVMKSTDALARSGIIHPTEHKIFTAYVRYAEDVIQTSLKVTDAPIKELSIQEAGRSLGLNPLSFNATFHTARKKLLEHSPELVQSLELLFGRERNRVKKSSATEPVIQSFQNLKGAKKNPELIAALEKAIDEMALKDGTPDVLLQSASRKMVAFTLADDKPKVFQLKTMKQALQFPEASMRSYIFRLREHLSTRHPELLSALTESYQAHPLSRLVITTGNQKNVPMRSLPGALIDTATIDLLEKALPSILPNKTHLDWGRALIRQTLSHEKGAQVAHEQYAAKSMFRFTNSYNNFVNLLRKKFAETQPDLQQKIDDHFKNTALHELLCETEPWIDSTCFDRSHTDMVKAARRYQNRSEGRS